MTIEFLDCPRRRPLREKRWIQGHRREDALAFPPQVGRRDEVVVNVDTRHDAQVHLIRRETLPGMKRGLFVSALSAAAIVPSAARAQTTIPLKIGIIPAEICGQIIYGVESGYFTRAGLDVQTGNIS